MAFPKLTPLLIIEHLNTKSKEHFADASAVYELLTKLKNVSGTDTKMLNLMFEVSHENGMVCQEAANLVNELLKLRAEKQLIQDNPGRE